MMVMVDTCKTDLMPSGICNLPQIKEIQFECSEKTV